MWKLGPAFRCDLVVDCSRSRDHSSPASRVDIESDALRFGLPTIPRFLLLCVSLSLSCTRPPDSETSDGPDRDSDSLADTGTRRNTAQRCGHGGYLDAWFPTWWTKIQEWDDSVLSEYPFPKEDPEHPYWEAIGYQQFDTFGYGSREITFADKWGAVQTDERADPKDQPDQGSVYVKGLLTQDEDRLLIGADGWEFDCTRRIRPTDPTKPAQQLDLHCVDSSGKSSVWVALGWNLDWGTVPADCLAVHSPPDMPSRWGLWERVDGGGESLFPHWNADETESKLWDLVLHSDGSGELVHSITRVDRTRDRLSWPLRTSESLTWRALEVDQWEFSSQEGSTMLCWQEPLGELGDEYRRFALACEDSGGVRTWWVPYDMAYPWGWGSHDTPRGWWW